MTTTAPANVTPTAQPAGTGNVESVDVATMFPADAELIASPEGDKKGLRKLQALARAEEARARR